MEGMNRPQLPNKSSSSNNQNNNSEEINYKKMYFETQKELKTQKEETEYLNELVSQLSVKERIATDEINQIQFAVRSVIARSPQLRKEYNLRLLGLLNSRVLQKAGLSEADAVQLMELIQSSWHPMVTDLSDPNKPVQKINREDSSLKTIRTCFGEEVANEVIRVFLELEEYNANARYPVLLPWDDKLQKPLKIIDQVNRLIGFTEKIQTALETIERSCHFWKRIALFSLFSTVFVWAFLKRKN